MKEIVSSETAGFLWKRNLNENKPCCLAFIISLENITSDFLKILFKSQANNNHIIKQILCKSKSRTFPPLKQVQVLENFIFYFFFILFFVILWKSLIFFFSQLFSQLALLSFCLCLLFGCASLIISIYTLQSIRYVSNLSRHSQDLSLMLISK